MFGGNILHSFNIPMQLTIHEIENRTKVGAFSNVWLTSDLHCNTVSSTWDELNSQSPARDRTIKDEVEEDVSKGK